MPFLTPPSVVVQAFSMPGGPEWLIILVIALLLFGRRLPALLRDVGGSLRQFRKGMEDGPEHLVAPGDAPRDSTPAQTASTPSAGTGSR